MCGFDAQRRARGVCVAAFLFVPLSAVADVSGPLVDHLPTRVGGPFSDTDFVYQFQPQWQLLADDIALSTPAAIRRVTWWGFYDQDNPPASETMRLRFYDARPGDGLPGATLFEQSFLNPLRTATGRVILLGVLPDEYFYDVLLSTPFAMQADTTYWLEIAQIGDRSTGFRWEDSASDNRRRASLHPGDTEWQDRQNRSDQAFQLWTVPEPATASFLSCLIVAVAFKNRRWSMT
jgi:hypothetical protein